MNTQKLYQSFQHKQKRNLLLATVLLLFMVATLGIDFLFARFQNSSFYLSESLLFSSYWLLFLPLLNLQWKLAGQINKNAYRWMLVVPAIAAHLLLYPALVWLLSGCFYPHTFAYRQTFDYGLTAYLLQTVLVYGSSLLVFGLYRHRPQQAETAAPETAVTDFLSSLVVSDSQNRKLAIATTEIHYFSASPPYVVLHHPDKKYLYTATLKSLEARLNPRQFVRVHKSNLVNICSVVSYQSRLNGDFDVMLTDGTLLRVSRHYAAAFKACFEDRHRLTLK